MVMGSQRAVLSRRQLSFRHDVNKRAKMTWPNPSPNRNVSRTRSPRSKSPSGRMARWPCKDYLKRTCTNSFCEKWHPPEWFFYKTKSGCRFGEKCSYAHRQVDEQPNKKSKRMVTKVHQPYWRSMSYTIERRDPLWTIDKIHARTGATRCKSWHPSWVKSRTWSVQFIERTTIGLCLSRHGAAEVDVNLTEELRHAETNPTCEIHEGYCTSH